MQYSTVRDREDMRQLWHLAVDAPKDATALAHKLLAEQGAGPLVDTETLERTVALANVVLEMMDPELAEDTPTDTTPAAPTSTLDKANAARLRKALDRRYRFDGTVMALGAFLASKDLLYRHCYTRHYARRKRDGYNKRLDPPAHEYSVWYLNAEGHEVGMGVPKMVYDSYAGTLPVRD